MTIVSPMGQLRPVFADKNGKRLSGGKVYTYEPGTLTPKATYADALNLILNTNPIDLNESGEADIYLDGGYRMQVFDRYGVLIQDVDNFRTWASGIPSDAISYNGQDLQQFNKSVEAAITDRYTKAETYNKTEVDNLAYSVAGGKYSFTTFAKFDAVKATIPANSQVNIDEAPTGLTTWGQGLNTWDGTTLSKSINDPLTQAKEYANANPLFKPFILQSGADLNNLASDGLYKVTANAATMLNLPEVANAMYYSMIDSAGNQVQFGICEATNNFYYRSKWSGSFKTWEKLEKSANLVPTKPRINSGSITLSTLTTPGKYTITTNATITDLPTDNPVGGAEFLLYVENLYDGGTTRLQKLLRNSGSLIGLSWLRRLTLDASGNVTTVGAWTLENRLADKQILPENLSASVRWRGTFTSVSLSTLTDDGLYTTITCPDRPSLASNSTGFLEVQNFYSGAYVFQIWRTFGKPSELFVRQVRATQVPVEVGEWFILGGSSGNSPFKGKKLICFGDSITENGTYPQQIGTRLGLSNAYNVGFGGCRWGTHNNALYDPMCMYQVANYIATDNLAGLMSAAIALRDSAFADDNTAQVATLQSIDFTTVDYVTIAYGTNDFNGAVPIGTSSDTTGATFKGAINFTIDKLLTKYPNLKILLITPIFRARNISGDGQNSDDFPNSSGIHMSEYVNAILEIGKKHHIPVLDAYNESCINRYNYNTYLSSDGLHPNNVGFEHLSNIYAAKLLASY